MLYYLLVCPVAVVTTSPEQATRGGGNDNYSMCEDNCRR